MELRFFNKKGEVRFFGGGSEGNWHIIEVEGLGLLPLTTQTVNYYGEHGQKTVSKTMPGRPITITAEVKGADRNDRAKIVSETLRILAKDGVLAVRTFRERVVDCYLKDLREGNRDGNFRTYVFQFMCDDCYFRDRNETEVMLSGRADLLKDGFIIGDGIVLTERRCGGRINNNSDVEVRGKLILVCNREGCVVVKNKTTGAELRLSGEAGNLYEIDLDERTIVDGDNVDCIGILNDDCYMSEFYLAEGVNDIVVSDVEGNDMVGSLKYVYFKKYVEATD
ncbi:MAG: phage tail family protein [Clostridia bacterium]|nr:phage tail family protein [Clostridia bacterium]